MSVKCQNAERNCTWEGNVSAQAEHVAVCLFTLLPCPNLCKGEDYEIKKITRKDLEEHLEKQCPNRDHECQYCGEKGTFVSITKVHHNICEKKLIACTSEGCTELIPRRDFEQHGRMCSHALLTCKHRSIGCKVKLKRKDMPEHELDDTLHLHMAINTISMLKENSDIVLQHGQTMTFRFTNYQAKKETEEMSTSSYFYTSHGYHMAFGVYLDGYEESKGEYICVSAPMVAGKYDGLLNWPFLGVITFTLLNQLEDKYHRTMRLHVSEGLNVRVGTKWAFTIIPHSALGFDPQNNTQYLKDDTLYFQLAVEMKDHKFIF